MNGGHYCSTICLLSINCEHLKRWISKLWFRKIGGPGTYNPATSSAWEDWYWPLFKMNYDRDIDDLLPGFFDHHGYNVNSRWDIIAVLY